MNRLEFDIPELLNFEAGTGLVRIPMQQDVPFTPRVRALVDTAEFQRLTHITQLGLVSRVYPGATHTRFEHALGVFYNALQYLLQLRRDLQFRETVDRHTAEVFLAAALVHDLGHWPFCHPIEDMALPDLPSHEEFAAAYLSHDSELAHVLRTQWSVEAEEILDVLVPKSDSPRLRLLRSMLSGPIDVDKMDYLDRDSLHAGVPYGRNFDRSRLIQSLLVNEAGDGLAISVKGKTAAELMVFARYVMFSEVYWHHAVRAASSMFARSFFELYPTLDLTAHFHRTEAETIDQLRRSSRGTPCEPLIEGIFGTRRVLCKRLAEYSLYQAPELYRKLAGREYAFLARCGDCLTEQLSDTLGRRLPEFAVLIDAPPLHREVEFRVDIYFPKEDLYRPLHEVSPVVDALARTQFDDYVKRVRVFAEPAAAAEISRLPNFTACLEKAIAETPP